MAKTDKAAKPINIDFTNVKDGGNFNKKRQTSGDYKAKVIKVADVPKKGEEKNSMWLFTITAGSGTYPYYCNYRESNQFWKIRNLFLAAGINIPKKRMSVDPNKVVGYEIGVTLEDDEYDGKAQSNISATFPTNELTGDSPDEDEESEPVEAPQGAGKTKKKNKKNKNKVKTSELEELDIDEI